MNNDVEFAHDLDVKIDEIIEQKITEPSKYKVIFLMMTQLLWSGLYKY